MYGPANISYHANSADVAVSWPGILLAVIAAMAIGFIWYGPLFGKPWMKEVGLTKKDTEKNWQAPIIAMLVLSFIQAVVLAHFIAYADVFFTGLADLLVGVAAGFWSFAGFVLPVLVANTMFSRDSKRLLMINLGNQLITLLAIGAILGSIN